MPTKRLVEKLIIKRIPVKQGWLVFDLKDYDIVLDQDFYIGFEFLPPCCASSSLIR
jgi:hypothetical protein